MIAARALALDFFRITTTRIDRIIRLYTARSMAFSHLWQNGYEDVSFFIRFFKKHTGFSPEAFRHKFS